MRTNQSMGDQFSRFLRTSVVALAVMSLAGCAAFPNPFASRETDPYASAPPTGDTVNPISLVSAEESIDDPDTVDPAGRADKSVVAKAKKSTKSFTNFVTGRESEDRVQAKAFYTEGDRLFRAASEQPADQRKKTFAAAAKQFKKAGEAAPGSALEQDSLFMRAESLFFADQLTLAADVYQKLQKEFPRNRHNDKIAARLFSISRYWIDTVKANDDAWFTLNLTDRSRPRLDTDGHAIRVLDQIRYDDPTGRLADDATMAAAAEYIRQEKFEEADEFLTDLRETFGDSEHLFLAHLLGIRCKLEVYAGPKYSGLILEEAETLVRQTRQRFPDKLADPKYGDMVARAAAEISYHRAESLVQKATFRERRNEFRAARIYYDELVNDYGDTPQAEIARKRLTQTDGLPAVPKQRLAWLTKVFPASRPTKPLIMNLPPDEPSTGTTPRPSDESSGPSGTIMR